MRHFILIVLCLAAGCAAQGPAPAPTAANLQGKQQAVPKKSRVVCTTEEVSGSYIPKRVCRDRHDMQIERERDRQFLDSNENTKSAQGE